MCVLMTGDKIELEKSEGERELKWRSSAYARKFPCNLHDLIGELQIICNEK